MEKWMTIAELQEGRRRCKGGVGFVPTMGFLHEGHLSLIKKAVKENDHVIVSIFVNPTQFGPSEDLEKYPKDIERDMRLCRAEGAAAVFLPSAEEIYPSGYQTFIEVTELTRHLCGLSRPTHFRGVCTVVAKLFHLVQPDKAYFGLKDYQQFKVLQRMVHDLHFPVETVPCPIVREADGLAMSSRNKYLSTAGRREALILKKALDDVRDALEKGERSGHALQTIMQETVASSPSARLDYARVAHGETLEDLEGEIEAEGTLFALAVFIENTRLIDNMVWSHD